ncbi:MAG: RNA methyltransferase [Tannerella sp.]|jgi:TrmH family RNA methyltransferase|nr:RNA methyltransferase [Tannerella sp.]
MLTKAKIKQIHSLKMKKCRDEQQLFVAEGNKLVADMLSSFRCEWMIAKPSWIATQGEMPVNELVEADNDDIRKISFLKTPQDVLALFRYPSYRPEEADPSVRLVLALDGVQDPGNLGAIVRIADWFGVEHIVCSPDSADVFGPKTVQATMGSLARVKVQSMPLENFLKQDVPVYGTFLDGEDIYCQQLTPHGIVVMGNEGNGIRPSIKSLISRRLYIPPYPATRTGLQSLNVAAATAVVCAEFRRQANSASA